MTNETENRKKSRPCKWVLLCLLILLAWQYAPDTEASQWIGIAVDLLSGALSQWST